MRPLGRTATRPQRLNFEIDTPSIKQLFLLLLLIVRVANLTLICVTLYLIRTIYNLKPNHFFQLPLPMSSPDGWRNLEYIQILDLGTKLFNF